MIIGDKKAIIIYMMLDGREKQNQVKDVRASRKRDVCKTLVGSF